MQQLLTTMSKVLSEIDHVYGTLYQKMTQRERISYCEILINTMKTSIKGSKNLHTIDTKRKDELIAAAQSELEILTDSTTKK
ncbi:MAG: hypothetical protein H0W73_06010 [Bacteroidetes bacterium]|nr:hypothetical protein [Bacteroidota bacterium]